MESIFRPLVLFSIILTIVFWLTPYFDYVWLSDVEIELLDQGGLGAVFESSDLDYWGTLFTWVLLSFGLYFYVRLAKPAFVAFYILNFVLTPFYGIQVLTGYEMLMSSLLGLIDGIILAMLFFTSVGARFAKNSIQDAQN
ncbi:hypothetical protein A9Q79_08800 [Methylophaga sp. 42_25_T18]|nr:hypothetical protein A9Q79_08800 [Methylophaga sp. 42_25_T18]OUR87749.1 hypothetical protein A9Q92_03860 [Methylophaga sp. 42_8_T64]